MPHPPKPTAEELRALADELEHNSQIFEGHAANLQRQHDNGIAQMLEINQGQISEMEKFQSMRARREEFKTKARITKEQSREAAAKADKATVSSRAEERKQTRKADFGMPTDEENEALLKAAMATGRSFKSLRELAFGGRDYDMVDFDNTVIHVIFGWTVTEKRKMARKILKVAGVTERDKDISLKALKEKMSRKNGKDAGAKIAIKMAGDNDGGKPIARERQLPGKATSQIDILASAVLAAGKQGRKRTYGAAGVKDEDDSEYEDEDYLKGRTINPNRRPTTRGADLLAEADDG